MENKDKEVKEEVCRCKEGEKCTCGDDCKCGDDCHCGEECHCDDKCNCGNDCKCKKSKKKIIFIIIGALLLIGLILCIYFFVIKGDNKDDNKTDNNIEDKVDKEENKDVENDETKVEQDDEIVEDEDVQDENNDEYEDDSYDEGDDNYDEGDNDYVPEPVKFFGLDGEYKYGELIVKKEYVDDGSNSLSFSYNLDSDSHLETFSIKRIESDDFEENYQIKYTDKDANGNDKVYSPVIKGVNGGLTNVEIVDINKNDGKLDVVINFYLDVSGEVVLFNVTTGEVFSFGPTKNTNIYTNEEGKIAIPIYYTVVFDLLFTTDYYVVGTDGKVTKNKIDLSNINKEISFEDDSFYYCTSSSECDYDEWIEFPVEDKVKLISYSEKDGFIAEYKGKKVFILAPWG